MAPEITSPAPPVTLAQNKPRPAHAAQGDWEAIPEIINDARQIDCGRRRAVQGKAPSNTGASAPQGA
jgi:hypothetical protein